jgi:hypothetical protein
MTSVALGFVFCLFIISEALSLTYYVRTDGNDGNSGLENSPPAAWASIQHAVDQAAAGDTVFVQAGVYPEIVIVSTAGLSGSPITLTGMGDVYLASLYFPGSNKFSRPVSYHYVIDSFIFDGSLDNAGFGIAMRGARSIAIANSVFQNFLDLYASGIYFINNGWTPCNAITVTGSHFENNVYGAATTSSGMLWNSTFQNCTFRNNAYGYYAWSWGTKRVTFSHCTFEDNEVGIVLRGMDWGWLGTQANLIHRSLFSHNGHGVLLGDMNREENSCSYDNHVVNCTFYRNAGSGVFIHTDFEPPGLPGQTVINNIFLENTEYGIDNYLGQSLNACYNLAYANGFAPGHNAPFDIAHHCIIQDPSLQNPEHGNFHLNFDSPAIDAGNPAYDGDPHAAGAHVDIGACECSAEATVEMADYLVEETSFIPEAFLKNKHNSLPLSKKIYTVMEKITRALEETDAERQGKVFRSALQRLQSDILQKTDGCATSGEPDKNDWIRDCETQADFYGPIMTMVTLLRQ